LLVRIGRPGGDAREVLHALLAGFLRAREEEPDEALRVGHVRGGERVDLVGPAMNSRSALRRRAREHEPANQPRPYDRNLLRDIAAERKAQ
jgi:hypothetical protein